MPSAPSVRLWGAGVGPRGTAWPLGSGALGRKRGLGDLRPADASGSRPVARSPLSRLPSRVRGRKQQPRHAFVLFNDGAVGRAERIAVVLGLDPIHLLSGLSGTLPPALSRIDALRAGDPIPDQLFLLHRASVCRRPVPAPAFHARGRPRAQPDSATSGHGHSPANALLGDGGHGRTLCLCHRRALGRQIGRYLAPCFAPLDAHSLDLSRLRSPARRQMGLCRTGVGWILGLGSGREFLADALAGRHRVSALDYDSRAQGHAQGMERGAGDSHLRAVYLRHLYDPQRHHLLGSRLCPIQYWPFFWHVPSPDAGFFFWAFVAAAAPAQGREPLGIVCLARNGFLASTTGFSWGCSSPCSGARSSRWSPKP